MNNNYLICGLMVLILILFIVDICKKKKNKEGFDSTSISIKYVKKNVDRLNTEMGNGLEDYDDSDSKLKNQLLKHFTYLLTLQRFANFSLEQMTDSEKRISALDTKFKRISGLETNFNSDNDLNKRISALETKFNSHKTDSEKRISALETEFNSHKGGTAIKEHSTF
jgi:hypothetical protein